MSNLTGYVQMDGLSQGADAHVLKMLNDYHQASWDKKTASLANIAVITLSSTTSISGSDLFVTISPSFYLVPATLPLNSVFCIGSVTKVFTGTMLAARVLDSQLKGAYLLTSDVKQWLPPSVANAGPDYKISSTTLEQLATHSACMARDVPNENSGLYNNEGAPTPEQDDAWLNNDNWTAGCTPGQKSSYSNWGSLTLGFAVAQPDGYNYDTTLARYIIPNFGMSAITTNTLNKTECVPGYGPDGQPRTGKAHGIRSSISDMVLFLSNYLGYSIPNDYKNSINFPEVNGSQPPIVNLALTPPLTQVPGVALDWFITSVPIGNSTYTFYDKNGETNAQGFSSYIGFSSYPTQPPLNEQQVQAGVIVLTNKAMAGRQPNPASFGRSLLKYLIGGKAEASPDEDRLEQDSDD